VNSRPGHYQDREITVTVRNSYDEEVPVVVAARTATDAVFRAGLALADRTRSAVTFTWTVVRVDDPADFGEPEIIPWH
jgi:hypothetical protein